MYRKPPIAPPWTGWDSSAPSLTLPSNSFRSITNWLINKQRLVPFPKLNNFSVNEVLYGARSFLDANALLHTLLLPPDRAQYLQAAGTVDQIGATWPGTSNPYAIEVYLNKAYFTNGSITTPLQYVDGSATLFKAGDVPGSSFFLGKLSARLLMLNTVENQFQFPARVRWSAVNNANEWDSTVDYTAGATDLSDIEDQITGWATINNSGFVFRNNGITVITPTGIGAAPWYIENFSIGPAGVGCQYPFTLSVYGMICAFVALDDVYVFTGQAPQAIGGAAKKSIFKDIVNASSKVTGTLLGTLGVGIDYKAYWLACPQQNDSFTSLWIYHFDDNSWVNVQLAGPLRVIANIATS